MKIGLLWIALLAGAVACQQEAGSKTMPGVTATLTAASKPRFQYKIVSIKHESRHERNIDSLLHDFEAAVNQHIALGWQATPRRYYNGSHGELSSPGYD